jgi:hypothetical protein
MSTEHVKPLNLDFRFWILLFTTTSLGFTLSTWLANYLFTTNWLPSLPHLWETGLIGLITGTLLGLSQWIALRLRFKKAILWVAACGLGWAIAFVVFAMISNKFRLLVYPRGLSLSLFRDEASIPIMYTIRLLTRDFVWRGLRGVFVGLCVGVFQFLLLRNRIKHSYWWLVLSILCWSITLGINDSFGAFPRYSYLNNHQEYFALLGRWMVKAIVSGCIGGFINATSLFILNGSLNTSVTYFRRSWHSMSFARRAVSVLGVFLIVIGGSFGLTLLAMERATQYLDDGWSYLASSPCAHPGIDVEIDRRVITLSDSVSVSVSLSNPSTETCIAHVDIYAPRFDVTPVVTKRELELLPNETGTIVWILTPNVLGSHQIGLASGLEVQNIGLTVTHIFGLSAGVVQVLTYIGAFMGSAITFPWLYGTWNERCKDREQQLRQEIELALLRKQLEPANKPEAKPS